MFNHYFTVFIFLVDVVRDDHLLHTFEFDWDGVAW